MGKHDESTEYNLNNIWEVIKCAILFIDFVVRLHWKDTNKNENFFSFAQIVVLKTKETKKVTTVEVIVKMTNIVADVKVEVMVEALAMVKPKKKVKRMVKPKAKKAETKKAAMQTKMNIIDQLDAFDPY